MPKPIDPSKLTEEIDGEVQAPQPEVTLRRPDGNPAVFPANMVEELLGMGFTLAEPGDFSDLRERNLEASFKLANANEIKKGVRIAEIVERAVAKAGKSQKGRSAE